MNTKLTNFCIALFTVVLTSLLSACATQKIETYQSAKPALNMYQFFNGKIEGWGMFQGRSGEVKRRFYVSIDATHLNDDIVLDEKFKWADGSTSNRVWRLTKKHNGMWHGTASDVVGTATGKVSGNALHWQYQLLLPVGDKTYKVDFDDWMYLITDDVMLNRSQMKKYGVELGSVTLSLHKK